MIKINGHKVKLLFDLGAMRILKDDLGIDYLDVAFKLAEDVKEGRIKEEEIGRDYNLNISLIYASINRYEEENGSDFRVTVDDLKRIPPQDYIALEMALNIEQSKNFPKKDEVKEKKKGKKQSRQS